MLSEAQSEAATAVAERRWLSRMATEQRRSYAGAEWFRVGRVNVVARSNGGRARVLEVEHWERVVT